MSPGRVTDEQLGRRALSGDREAFGELFGRHESGLYNVSYRLTGSREDAADITQEAFLRVFARLDDLGGGRSTWRPTCIAPRATSSTTAAPTVPARPPRTRWNARRAPTRRSRPTPSCPR